MFVPGVFAVFRRFLPLVLFALPLAVACSVEDSASSELTAGPSNPEGDGTMGVVQNPPTSNENGSTDAGATGALCGLSLTTCSPDDDGRLGLTAPQACATPVLDGGTRQTESADGSSTTTDYACRVTLGEGPACGAEGAMNADTRGIDGVSCQSDTDCAPGFDCVAPGSGEKSNVCRRYCCSSSCEGVTSQNGGPTFCDVRQVVRSVAAPIESPLVAPVCMPIKTCTLLKEGDCADGETCAIVNDKGTTGCVPTGGAHDGESCEKKHCEKGLTCLGSTGDRTCYKLCKTTGDGQECGANNACTTSSAFLDTAYGVCKPTK